MGSPRTSQAAANPLIRCGLGPGAAPSPTSKLAKRGSSPAGHRPLRPAQKSAPRQAPRSNRSYGIAMSLAPPPRCSAARVGGMIVADEKRPRAAPTAEGMDTPEVTGMSVRKRRARAEQRGLGKVVVRHCEDDA